MLVSGRVLIVQGINSQKGFFPAERENMHSIQYHLPAGSYSRPSLRTSYSVVQNPIIQSPAIFVCDCPGECYHFLDFFMTIEKPRCLA